MFLSYSGSPPSAAATQALATDIGEAAAAHLASVLSETYSITFGELEDLSSDTGNSAITDIAAAGTRSGTANDVALCVLLNHSIGRRYRGGHPKTFWPWGVEGDLLNNNAWESASITAFDAAWVAFLAAIVGASSGGVTITGLVNVSFYSGFTAVMSPTTGRYRNIPKLRANPVIDPIVNTAVNAIPSTQRRREQRG